MNQKESNFGLLKTSMLRSSSETEIHTKDVVSITRVSTVCVGGNVNQKKKNIILKNYFPSTNRLTEITNT